MFKIATLCAVTLVAAFAGTAQAQDTGKYYVEAGYANIKSGDNYGAANLGAGVKFSKHFAVEANAALGITERKYGDVTAKVDSVLGGYLVGSYPVSENVEVLGRVGYVRRTIKADMLGYDISEADNAVAVGIGARYFPKGGVHGVRADLTHWTFKGGDSNQLSISYVRRF